ncbi:MAG: exodeoxyribonuclease VII large subunit [Phycisphaerales bacterium]|nr:MAG: exodeoxyribonuclease VII large subunit [Phycisphaerales bacterium]
MGKAAKTYTVSEVNTLVKAALEEMLPPRLIVRGEITDFKHHVSGHCYFSLKDEGGILPCVMWASKFRAVKFSPEDGMAVLAKGHIDVYTAGGKYQLYVDKIEPEGVGALQLAFEQMVKTLKAEGLFEDEYKKAIPQYPERIGILTSESGAAVHDIQDSIHSRWPCVKLFLYPVPVQGEGAAEQIAAAVRNVNRRNSRLKLDILIVGRGGGSLEDLWAFNEEVLARAIFDSTIPVISAVGHEVDVTIADLVADKRASTPTKAGVVAVPDMEEVLAQLAYFETRLGSQARAELQMCAETLRTILASAVFRNPLMPVRDREQQLDELSAKLIDQTKELLATARDKLHRSYEQIVRIEPHRLLGKMAVDLNDLQNRARAAMGAISNSCCVELAAVDNRLAALNPKSVLGRGYSITTNKKTSLVVRSLDDVQMGDELITELAREHKIESKVTHKQEGQE